VKNTDAALPHLHNLSYNPSVFSLPVPTYRYHGARLYPLGRLEQGLPAARLVPPQQQYLQAPAAALFTAVKPGRHHAAVVQNQNIARPQIVAQFIETAVLYGNLLLLNYQKTRLVSVFQRLLGDKLPREVIIKIACLQCLFFPCAWR
jgi:hypothetical protein